MSDTYLHSSNHNGWGDVEGEGEQSPAEYEVGNEKRRELETLKERRISILVVNELHKIRGTCRLAYPTLPYLDPTDPSSGQARSGSQ